MRLALLFLAMLVCLTACKKQELDITSFWNCNKTQNPDTTAISQKLIGSWRWSKQACFGKGNTISANRNINVIFKTNHTFVVIENTTALSQGTWKLMQVDDNSWGLNLSSTSEFLSGRILFCDNQVLFNNCYIDGCDNLFTRDN